MTETVVYGPVTFTQTSTGWSGYTLVHCISSALLGVASGGDGTSVRFTVEFLAFSGDATMVAYWGESGGDNTYDFNGNQQQLTWAGNGTLTGDGSTLIFTSDWVVLGEVYDEAVMHNIACQFTGSTVSIPRAVSGSVGNEVHYLLGADAVTTNKSGYTFSNVDVSVLLKQVEIATVTELARTSTFDAAGGMESAATVSSEPISYSRSALFEATGGMASSAAWSRWRPRHTRSQIMLEGNLRPTSNLATWSDRLELYDSETGQPIDLVEQVVAISMALRDIYTGTVVLKGDLVDGTVWVVNPGLIEWSFPPETMAGLDPKAYDVGCLVEMAGETIQVLLGHVSVKRGL